MQAAVYQYAHLGVWVCVCVEAILRILLKRVQRKSSEESALQMRFINLTVYVCAFGCVCVCVFGCECCTYVLQCLLLAFYLTTHVVVQPYGRVGISLSCHFSLHMVAQ